MVQAVRFYFHSLFLILNWYFSHYFITVSLDVLWDIVRLFRLFKWKWTLSSPQMCCCIITMIIKIVNNCTHLSFVLYVLPFIFICLFHIFSLNWCWIWNILGELGWYFACWCLGCLCHQVISRNVEWTNKYSFLHHEDFKRWWKMQMYVYAS